MTMSDLSTVVAANQMRRMSATHSAAARRRKRSSVASGHCGMLDAAIRRVSTVFSGSSHEHWVIRMPAMRRIAHVDLSAEWLSVSLPLRRLSMPISLKIIGSMLSRNARIDGSSRIIGQRQPGRRQIVADIPVDMVPWDCATDLDTLVDGTIAGLRAALSPNGQHTESLSPAGLPREQIEAIFDEAGWPAQLGEAEQLEVPLEVPGNYFVATVDHGGPSARLSVPILPTEFRAASQYCRGAVSVLLWLTASRIRMVKAMRSRRALALEVSLLPGHCNAIGLAHACAALSVALQHCAAEATLLVADEELAQIYLSKLGFPTSL